MNAGERYNQTKWQWRLVFIVAGAFAIAYPLAIAKVDLATITELANAIIAAF